MQIRANSSSDIAWLPHFLLRASGALLRVTVESPLSFQTYSNIFKALAPYAATIRSFAFSCVTWSFTDEWSTLMDTIDCMQSLERLQLSCSIHDLQPASMDTFTRDQLPQLRSIRLEKIHFPWSSSVYSCLHELSISHVKPGPSAPELNANAPSLPGSLLSTNRYPLGDHPSTVHG